MLNGCYCAFLYISIILYSKRKGRPHENKRRAETSQTAEFSLPDRCGNHQRPGCDDISLSGESAELTDSLTKQDDKSQRRRVFTGGDVD